MGVLRIKTKRLELRPADNGKDLNRYLADLTPDEYLYQFGCEFDERLLEDYDFTINGVICYSIFMRDTDTMIGYAGIKPCEDNPSVGDLEYYIFKEYREQGYCQEAVRAMIESFHHGELDGTKGMSVVAEIVQGNDASAHILEKLGFVKTSVGLHVYANEEEELRSVGVVSYELTLCPDTLASVGLLCPAA